MGRPRLIDAALFAVSRQVFIYFMGYLSQRDLPQRAQVAFPEPVPESRVDLIRHVDVASLQAMN